MSPSQRSRLIKGIRLTITLEEPDKSIVDRIAGTETADAVLKDGKLLLDICSESPEDALSRIRVLSNLLSSPTPAKKPSKPERL